MTILIGTLIVAGLIAALALDFLRWRRQRRRIKRSFRSASVRGVGVPYVDLGPRQGPPVLFFTGGGAGIDAAYGLPWLTDAGYRLIAVCRPGYYGVPFDLAPTLRAQADLHAEVLASIGVRAPVHVFGVSAGGPAAIIYAGYHPARSLLLWSAVTGPYTPNPEAMDSALGRLVLSTRGQTIISWLLGRSARLAPKATMATFLQTESTLSKPEIRAVVEQTLASPEGRAQFQSFVDSTTPMTELFDGMMDELKKMKDWQADWDRIRVPTMAVGSTVDNDVPIHHLERVRRHLPEARILEVRAGGHFVWWGREGEAVIAAALEHLERSTRA